MLTIPFLDRLKTCRSVLIAGAGGGFDIFSGLPLYFALRHSGIEAHLANLSFSSLAYEGHDVLGPNLVRVTADAVGRADYFPERSLSDWFLRARNEKVPIYAFRKTGVRPLAEAYRSLLRHLNEEASDAGRAPVDAVVLADGGSDSLMRGDEEGLGTPAEDMSSLAAVRTLGIAEGIQERILLCLGLGVDVYHGVCNAHSMEAIAELTAAGAFLGSVSLMRGAPEVERYLDAVQHAQRQTTRRESIVCSSIVAAIEGHYGDYHATRRTWGTELDINPLMAVYWAFDVEAAARRVMYLDELSSTETATDIALVLEDWRNRVHPIRKRRALQG